MVHSRPCMESINFRVQSVWVFTIVAYLWLAIVNAHADILLKFNLVLTVKFCKKKYIFTQRRPCQGRSHVACLNFKTSRVDVYKCLSLIVGFAVTVAIWPREVVICRDFILRATFWAMSLVRIYPGRASQRGSLKSWYSFILDRTGVWQSSIMPWFLMQKLLN